MRHFRTKARLGIHDTAQRANREWSGFLEEHVSSILSIQLLGRERRQERTAFRLLAHAACAQMRLFRSGIWFSIFTSLAVVSAMSAVIGYGGWKVTAGALSVGSLVAFYSFVTQLFEPLSGAAELYARAQRAFSSIRQLRSVLALQPTIADSAVPSLFRSRIGGCGLPRLSLGTNNSETHCEFPHFRFFLARDWPLSAKTVREKALWRDS